MKVETLTKLRLLVPGIIILIGWWLLGKLTNDWKIVLPSSWKDAGSLLSVIVPSVVYYATPLRKWSNAKYHKLVSESLRSGLVKISKKDDDAEKYSWEKVRKYFWPIIDNDNSLTVKSKLAYSNGLIWTSIADVRVISASFCLFSTLYWYFLDSSGALVASIIFFVVSLISLPLSHLVTKRHISIGKGQLEIIEGSYSKQVREFFEKLDE